MSSELYIIIALLAGSAFFSASETAFTSLSLMQIKEVQRRKPSVGRLLERLYHKPDLIITTILIGNNIVNTSIATFTTQWVESFSGDTNLALITGAITLLILVFGEVTPKQIAIAANVPIAVFSIRILYVLSFLFRPVIWVMSFVSKLISLLRGNKGRNTITVEGILHLVQHARSIGLLEDYESRMVKSVFRFSDVNAHSIMTHRTLVFSLSCDDTMEEALPKIIESGYTQLPVWEGSTENIVGFIREKDLLHNMTHPDTDRLLRDIMIDPVVVPETWSVPKVFAKFKREKATMAVVLDEYGGLAGLITMTDVISQIIGDLDDEHRDHGERFAKEADGSWLIPGDEPLYHLEEISGVEVAEARNGLSLAAYIEEVLAHIPERGESLDTPLGHMVVRETNGTRIITVAFKPNLQ